MSRHSHPWRLDPTVTFLNHGSFGACPTPVLDAQTAWRERMERDPVAFMVDELEPALDEARGAIAGFVGATPADVAFVPNASTGVSTVVRSLAARLRPTDEIITTDHEYNATLNALRWLSAATGAQLRVCRVPFADATPDAVVDAVLGGVTARTRVAVISHVTSATALVLPVERLVPALARLGIETLVDGAHAPGMVPLDLEALGAGWYTGNGHKWLCGPKGSGFLHVRRDLQAETEALVMSHGSNSARRDRSRFRLTFDWTGTSDMTPFLALPEAIRSVGSLDPDGWPGVMRRNAEQARSARDTVAAALAIPPSTLPPPEMLGAMAAIPLPEGVTPAPVPAPADGPDRETVPDDPLHADLYARERIQVPVYAWPASRDLARGSTRMIRVSAQVYNEPRDYLLLAQALRARLSSPGTGTRSG